MLDLVLRSWAFSFRVWTTTSARQLPSGCAKIAIASHSDEIAPSSTSAPIMAEHDLCNTIIPYLDRHLSFPLLVHLAESTIFPIEEVQAAQYELARGTNMVDYAVNLFEQTHPDEEVPAGTSNFSVTSPSLTYLPNNRRICCKA